MKQFTWGIIGPGKIANKFALALTLVEGARLGAVASRDIARARSFAETHGKTTPVNAYDSYQQLATDPSIDAIYIATPHGYHAEHAILCLNHGKAVLCEKPMALSARQVNEMIDAARTNHAFLMEAMWTRFLPLTEQIDQLIGDGQLGDLRYIRADFGFHAPFNPDGRLYDLRLGGGSLLDIGIYPLFLCLHLLGEPETITAAGHLAPTGADDTCHAILQFREGRSAVISSNLTCQTSITAEIAGTHGAIQIPTPWYKNDRFTLQQTTQPPASPQSPATTGSLNPPQSPATIRSSILPRDPQLIQLEPMINGFEYQIRETIHCVSSNLIESPKMSFDFSLLMARTMDTIRTQLGVRYPTE
ncbi:MAG: Gfo/Idh/MocA family oxidoreductase [Bacteroidetes bacterium]|nr:Gfo/Idh/MocA family oxidoreductase [Bacteroidota bacterium]